LSESSRYVGSVMTDRMRKIHNIHFVGIGGVGMAGIAEVLLNLDYAVQGSDLRATRVTRRLESLKRLFMMRTLWSFQALCPKTILKWSRPIGYANRSSSVLKCWRN
jgi:hypothetical protein